MKIFHEWDKNKDVSRQLFVTNRPSLKEILKHIIWAEGKYSLSGQEFRKQIKILQSQTRG